MFFCFYFGFIGEALDIVKIKRQNCEYRARKKHL